ncbi:hypothetical protein, partial [Okeania sp. SIO2B3]|uniref:hypothetical protein n=1 Tax=Okeania sp. SIO2B3 TaxID=2607784 RepID=UPI0013C2506C
MFPCLRFIILISPNQPIICYLQTKLMAVVTLMVSLLMSSFSFWAVNTIQQDARLNDTRYGR